MDEQIAFDLDEITLGEMEELEDLLGVEAVRDLMNGKGASAKMLVTLVYIFKRRTNPEFTMDEARKMKVTALSEKSAEGKESAAAG